MSNNEQGEQPFQVIRQQIAALQEQDPATWESIDAALEDLQVNYEQMRITLETSGGLQEEILQQQQYYQNLFQFFPIASLVTDAHGVILEANQAIAQLLNVSSTSLIGQPLAVLVAEDYRRAFEIWLHQQLSQPKSIQVWQTHLRPQQRDSVPVTLHVAIAHDTAGRIEYLRLGCTT